MTKNAPETSKMTKIPLKPLKSKYPKTSKTTKTPLNL